MSQIEIAHELQVSKQLISSDVQYLRNQAKESIREYVTEHFPEQYSVCLAALDAIIKRSFAILETAEDNREKLQAMELYKDTHLVKLELLSNATTIDSALSYITNKQQQQREQQHQKRLSLDSLSTSTTANENNNDSDSSSDDGNDDDDQPTNVITGIGSAGRQTVF
jgi:tRNA(Ile)-lysidine synthase TilS/MesJ